MAKKKQPCLFSCGLRRCRREIASIRLNYLPMCRTSAAEPLYRNGQDARSTLWHGHPAHVPHHSAEPLYRNGQDARSTPWHGHPAHVPHRALLNRSAEPLCRTALPQRARCPFYAVAWASCPCAAPPYLWFLPKTTTRRHRPAHWLPTPPSRRAWS